MINLIMTISHSIYTFCLLFIWLIPVFQTTFIFGKRQMHWKSSIALAMFLKIIKPESQIHFLGGRQK